MVCVRKKMAWRRRLECSFDKMRVSLAAVRQKTAYFTVSTDYHMMSSDSPVSLSYRDAGVDIDAGDALVEAIKPFARKTMREGVLGGIGGFGALFEISKKLQGAGAGVRHRRRRHQAQAGFPSEPA